MLGCGKTVVNGEPYYIAQMDTPGVIAGEPGFDKSNVGQPKEVNCSLLIFFGEWWWGGGGGGRGWGEELSFCSVLTKHAFIPSFFTSRTCYGL